MAHRPRSAFDQALSDLQAEAVGVAALVPEAVAAATAALLDLDHDLARRVVEGHAGVAQAARRCEERAYGLLVRQQPTAGDLRSLVTTVRLTHETERAAKLACHVAEFALRPPAAVLSPRVRGLLARMAAEAQRLFLGAIDAYVDRDLARAEALDVWDDRTDELHRRLLQELFTAGLGMETTLELALVGRYLERIADHAVVIGERVRYLVTGTLAEPAPHVGGR